MNIPNITKILCCSLFTSQLFICCKENNSQNQTAPINTSIEKTQKITFKIEFPDTVYINQLNDGEITYSSVLDTIITTFGDSKKNRYTRFIMTTSTNVDYDYKELKTKAKDTFGALNNRSIPFYDIKFGKAGVYYIDGIINDIVLIDTITKNKSNYDVLRFIENEERVTKKIVVLDRKGNMAK